MFKWLMAGFGLCVLLSLLTGDERFMAYGWGVILATCFVPTLFARPVWRGYEREEADRRLTDRWMSNL